MKPRCLHVAGASNGVVVVAGGVVEGERTSSVELWDKSTGKIIPPPELSRSF